MTDRIAVIGAGIGGLAAAISLAAAGEDVVLFDRRDVPGGKIHTVGTQEIDGGPTVFTMRWIFDAMLDAAGTSLDELVTIEPLDVLARHAWRDGSTFDLFLDEQQSVDAIGRFAGAEDAAGYRRFCADTKAIFTTLDAPFMAQPAPSMMTLLKGASFGDLWQTRPFTTMWRALGDYFKDPRLRQLFGRYATYCGSSPFLAPATLMLVAYVEQAGVWTVKGGMIELVHALDRLAQKLEVWRRYSCPVTDIKLKAGRVSSIKTQYGDEIEVAAAIFNGDCAALGHGLLGNAVRSAGPLYPAQSRSLSALTWAVQGRGLGFDYHRHNVFFSDDYPLEFTEILQERRLPTQPTLYVCAQDRGAPSANPADDGSERFLCLVNAPADGDGIEGTIGDPPGLSQHDIERCEERTWAQLKACGADIQVMEKTVTSPVQFSQMFPATGGALYGMPAHGWQASFQRRPIRSKVLGLYLAGGSVHPGPGVPMAARSGHMAAQCVLADRASIRKYHQAATIGGTSTG